MKTLTNKDCMLSCWQLYYHPSGTIAKCIRKTGLKFTDSKFAKIHRSVRSSCNNKLSFSWKHSCDFSRCELTRLFLCRAVSSPWCVRVSGGSAIDIEAPPVSTDNTETTVADSKKKKKTNKKKFRTGDRSYSWSTFASPPCCLWHNRKEPNFEGGKIIRRLETMLRVEITYVIF